MSSDLKNLVLASIMISITEGSMVHTYLTIEIIYKKRRGGFVSWKHICFLLQLVDLKQHNPPFQIHSRVKCSPSLQHEEKGEQVSILSLKELYLDLNTNSEELFLDTGLKSVDLLWLKH